MVAPALLLVPLLATESGTALMGAAGAGIAAYLAGNAIKNTINGPKGASVLTPQSPPAEFSTATSNYMKAEQDYEAAKGRSLGGVAAKDVAKEIAQNYDYIGVDETTGNLVVLADKSLAAGGDLSVSVANGKIGYNNGSISKSDLYTDYTQDGITSAVPPGTSVSTAVNEDGLPLLTATPPVTTQSLVAETILQKQKIMAIPPVFIKDDPLTFTNPTRAFGQLPATTSPTASPTVDQQLEAQIARAVANAGAWKEDAATVSDQNSVPLAAHTNATQAMQSAAAAGSSNPNLPVSPPPPPTPTTGFVSQKPPPIITGGSSPSATKAAQQENANPLHDYGPYTYKFSLYALTKANASLAASGGISPGQEDTLLQGATLLISSGGSVTANKGANFQEDFYIDNVVFTSILGQSSRNRGTDVINFSFDVNEPYNITLLPRLLRTAQDITGQADWAMAFYVMKLDFIGYTENGYPITIPNTSKFIPFQFTSCEFDIGNKGAVYRFKCIPSNHLAQTYLDNEIPFHMEIHGGTLNDVFNGSIVPVAKTPNARGDATKPSVGQGGGTISKGIAESLSKAEDFYVKKKAKNIANKYSFRFEGGIGDKKVYDPKTWSKQGFRMSDPKKAQEQLPRTIQLDKDKNAFRVQAGTKITDLLNGIIQMSEFYSGQYKSPSPKDKPLLLHKIIPEIKFLGYDDTTNMWARDVTYVIVPYKQHGTDHEGFPQQAPVQAIKRYKWIFTGQNRDVIDLKMSYKSAFFTLRNGGEAAQLQADTDVPPPDAGADQNPDPAEKPKKGMFPTRVKVVAGLANQSNTGARNQNKKTFAVEELFHKQFDQQGDNVQLDITIVGDPDLIQQDNILYGANAPSDTPVYSNGAINFAFTGAFFYFQFVTPMKDYNDDNGLFDVNNETAEHFNGYYQIQQITSEFRGGKFTQKLQNTRAKNQSNTDSQPARPAAGTPAGTATSTVAPPDVAPAIPAYGDQVVTMPQPVATPSTTPTTTLPATAPLTTP